MRSSLKLGIVTVFGCLIALQGFSQGATVKRKVPPTSVTSLSDEKNKVLCKPWVLDTVIEFGTFNKPKGKEMGDGITFVADGSFFMTEEGVAYTGKWVYSGGRLNATTTNPDRKISFKIISLEDKRMALEYQTPDLIKIQYVYWPKK